MQSSTTSTDLLNSANTETTPASEVNTDKIIRFEPKPFSLSARFRRCRSHSPSNRFNQGQEYNGFGRNFKTINPLQMDSIMNAKADNQQLVDKADKACNILNALIVSSDTDKSVEAGHTNKCHSNEELLPEENVSSDFNNEPNAFNKRTRSRSNSTSSSKSDKATKQIKTDSTLNDTGLPKTENSIKQASKSQEQEQETERDTSQAYAHHKHLKHAHKQLVVPKPKHDEEESVNGLITNEAQKDVANMNSNMSIVTQVSVEPLLQSNHLAQLDLDEGEIKDDEDEAMTTMSMKKMCKSAEKSQTEDELKLQRSSSKTEASGQQYTIGTVKLIKDSLINKKIQNSRLKSIDQLTNVLGETWTGVFTLKKHFFPTKFYLLAGSKSFAEQMLPLQTANGNNCLRISQRLRLDSNKLEELERFVFYI